LFRNARGRKTGQTREAGERKKKGAGGPAQKTNQPPSRLKGRKELEGKERGDTPFLSDGEAQMEGERVQRPRDPLTEKEKERDQKRKLQHCRKRKKSEKSAAWIKGKKEKRSAGKKKEKIPGAMSLSNSWAHRRRKNFEPNTKKNRRRGEYKANGMK